MEKIKLSTKETLENVANWIENELENENIIGADVKDNLLVVRINQSKSYRIISEPLEDFYSYDDIEEVSIYELNGVDFTIVEYEHFNTTVYTLTLKIYDCYR